MASWILESGLAHEMIGDFCQQDSPGRKSVVSRNSLFMGELVELSQDKTEMNEVLDQV